MTHVLACLVTGVHLDDATSAPGCLPALLLSGDGEPGGLGSRLEHLVGRGWTYAEPPVRITQIPAQRPRADTPPARRPVLLVPCPPLDSPTLARLGRPPQSRGEWSQRVRELGRRCALVLAPTVDLHAPDLRDQLDSEASRGRVVWATVRITDTTPVPSERHSPVAP